MRVKYSHTKSDQRGYYSHSDQDPVPRQDVDSPGEEELDRWGYDTLL